jgi:pilus assembly protein Flp/PilA
MKPLRNFLLLLQNRSGATVVEYCLIAGLIALAVVGAVTSIGTTTNGSFVEVSEKVWGA